MVECRNIEPYTQCKIKMISERKASYGRHRMTPKNGSWGMSGQWPKTTVLQREILLNYFGTFLYKLHVACICNVILTDIFFRKPEIQSQTVWRPAVHKWAYMGTFADTAIVNYSLSFADQRKQTSIWRVRLQRTNRSWPFAVFRLQQTKGSCSC